MQPTRNIRDFFLKIGFVITLALSFNPVDAFAEPVVISLPVVEQTEWVLEGLPYLDSQTKPDFSVAIIPVEEQFGRESRITLFFRQIHYERLVRIQLNSWSEPLQWIHQTKTLILRQFISAPEQDEAPIA